jgi:hypothetical protein
MRSNASPNRSAAAVRDDRVEPDDVALEQPYDATRRPGEQLPTTPRSENISRSAGS